MGAERGWGGAVDVRPGAHVRLPAPPPPRPRHMRFPADTPSHGVPLERSETQHYRLADLAANVSKRSRRLVHLRFPVARVTPMLAEARHCGWGSAAGGVLGCPAAW